MSDIEWTELRNRVELGAAAADAIRIAMNRAVQRRGAALVALPGGSTPDTTFASLAAHQVDWAKVTIVPLDDRLVPAADPQSTFAKLRTSFGSTRASIVPLVDEDAPADYRRAGRLADKRLLRLDWPLDLACLGMGGDGHTASIFPGTDFAAALYGAPELRAVGVRAEPPPADGPAERVTLTGASIRAARDKMILLSGEKKRKVLERAIADGSRSAVPIGRLLAAFTSPVRVFWCPD